MFCPVSVNPEVMAWFLVLSCFSEAGGDGMVSCFVLFQGYVYKYCFSEPGGDGMVSCLVLFQGYVCTVSVNPEVMAWFHVLYCFRDMFLLFQ